MISQYESQSFLTCGGGRGGRCEASGWVSWAYTHTHTHAITKLFFQLCFCYFEVIEDISEKKIFCCQIQVFHSKQLCCGMGCLFLKAIYKVCVYHMSMPILISHWFKLKKEYFVIIFTEILSLANLGSFKNQKHGDIYVKFMYPSLSLSLLNILGH